MKSVVLVLLCLVAVECCFHSDVYVKVLEDTKVRERRITDLRVGDNIKTPDGFSSMIGWLYKDPNIVSTFVTVHTELISITLTGDHYIDTYIETDHDYKNVHAVKTEELRPCDWLVNDNQDIEEVVHVTKNVSGIGMFCPYVSEGNFYVIDGSSNGTEYFQVSVYAQRYPNPGQKERLHVLMKEYAKVADPDDIRGIHPGVKTSIEKMSHMKL